MLFDKSKLGKLVDYRDHPERHVESMAMGLDYGRLPSRPLTTEERLAVTLGMSRPSMHLTLTSVNLTLDSVPGAFVGFRKSVTARMSYGRRTGRPFIYFGCHAHSRTDLAGAHTHLLVWGYVPAKFLAAAARTSGYANFNIRTIHSFDKRPADDHGPNLLGEAFGTAAYVISQRNSVFGSKKHLSNRNPPNGSRTYIRPFDSTLRAYRREVLSAINTARDRSVTDDELLARWPVFTRSNVKTLASSPMSMLH